MLDYQLDYQLDYLKTHEYSSNINTFSLKPTKIVSQTSKIRVSFVKTHEYNNRVKISPKKQWI